jgi:hypothetical protein
VHVEIEAIAADILAAIDRAGHGLRERNAESVSGALRDIATAVRKQIAVLRRIPEKMDPALYYRTFRPYIRFFENVVYEGVVHAPLNFRGETGAQSSIIPTLVAFMKIPHRKSVLTDHLAEMRHFMPQAHRQLIADVEAMPSPRDLAHADSYATCWMRWPRSVRRTSAGRRSKSISGSTIRAERAEHPMEWLRQLIDETRSHKLIAAVEAERAGSTTRSEKACVGARAFDRFRVLGTDSDENPTHTAPDGDSGCSRRASARRRLAGHREDRSRRDLPDQRGGPQRSKVMEIESPSRTYAVRD